MVLLTPPLAPFSSYSSCSPWEASYHALLIRAALLQAALDRQAAPAPQEVPLDLSCSTEALGLSSWEHDMNRGLSGQASSVWLEGPGREQLGSAPQIRNRPA